MTLTGKKVEKPGAAKAMLPAAQPMYKQSALLRRTTQAERFTRERSATFQYAIDVFATAFVLTVIVQVVEKI